ARTDDRPVGEETRAEPRAEAREEAPRRAFGADDRAVVARQQLLSDELLENALGRERAAPVPAERGDPAVPVADRREHARIGRVDPTRPSGLERTPHLGERGRLAAQRLLAERPPGEAERAVGERVLQ